MKRAFLFLAAAAVLVAAAGTAPPGGDIEVLSIDHPGYARAIGALKGRAIVVNMWATWCEPCRDEFPELVAFEKEMRPKGVVLLTVSMDLTSALTDQVIPFLRQQGVTSPSYIKSAGDDDVFINAVDPGWTGGLPATFIYARDGKLVSRLEGPIDRKRLTAAVLPLLESTPKP